MATKRNERTSEAIASIAGQLLNGAQTHRAQAWLEHAASSPDYSPEDRDHAVVLLGLLASLRRVAASALTQRG